MQWSNQQIQQWKLRQKDYIDVLSSMPISQDDEEIRHKVQQVLAQLLHMFLQEKLSLKEFHTVFQQATSSSLNVFGLRGLSGGMFFSKLLKYFPDENVLVPQLRAVLHLPQDVRDGQQRMQEFTEFLEKQIASLLVTRAQIQPARVPFFVSVWWHFQDKEQWPIFYPVVHNVLALESGYTTSLQDVVEVYFAFRAHFLSLAQELTLSSWELEQIVQWYGQKSFREGIKKGEMKPLLAEHKKWVPSRKDADVQMIRVEEENAQVATFEKEHSIAQQQKQEEVSHTHVQWLLAKIGLKVGCQVWIATNDQHKVWKQERLGDLSLKFLPAFGNSLYRPIISLIDVLWFWHDDIVAAYEIREAKDIATGLLRLYDLGSLVPKHDLELCIVVPRECLRRVQFELDRPVFRHQESQKRCALIDEEQLVQHGKDILRWAGSPTVIQDLINYLGPEESVE